MATTVVASISLTSDKIELMLRDTIVQNDEMWWNSKRFAHF